jgi:hypothetical protein
VGCVNSDGCCLHCCCSFGMLLLQLSLPPLLLQLLRLLLRLVLLRLLLPVGAAAARLCCSCGQVVAALRTLRIPSHRVRSSATGGDGVADGDWRGVDSRDGSSVGGGSGNGVVELTEGPSVALRLLVRPSQPPHEHSARA